MWNSSSNSNPTGSILFFNEDLSFRLNNKTILRQWILNTVTNHGFIGGDLNFIFTSEEYIVKINQEFLNHNYPTDVITFPYTVDKVISADIYICIAVVKSNAKDFKQTFLNELHRVMIHAILHLLGYNDSTDDEIEQMRLAEDIALRELNNYFSV